MALIFKNKTGSDANVSYANVTQVVPANTEYDLVLVFQPWQLASSESLYQLIAQGTDKYQLNDGTQDLSLLQAINHLQGRMPLYGVDSTGNLKAITADSSGNIGSASKPPTGLIRNHISPNWCYKPSWCWGSKESTNETLTDSGNHILFTSAHENWIDLTHGKKTFEKQLLIENPGKWLVSIKADGEGLVQDVDYTVNFATGAVTFSESQQGKVITASYWYADTGLFLIKPRAGKKYTLQKVEIQFSKNIELMDSVYYQAYGYVGVFWPEGVQAPYNLPADYLIPIGDYWEYNNFDDYISDSSGAFPLVPAFGAGTRGRTQDIITLQWPYLSRNELYASYGMQLEIGMLNNIAHIGEMVTATVYGYEENE